MNHLFPDLLLLQTHDFLPKSITTLNGYSYTAGGYKELLEKDKTEFSLAIEAPNIDSVDRFDHARELGFKPIAAMNNWYIGHRHENRKLTLWWKHNPNFVRATRYDDYYISVNHRAQGSQNNYSDSFLFGAGCGYKLITRFCYNFKHHVLKSFCLLRLPPRLTNPQKRCLTWLNYKCIGEGELASYWTNGFEPETYDYNKIEAPFWEEWTRKYGNPNPPRSTQKPIPIAAAPMPVVEAPKVFNTTQVNLGRLNIRPGLEIPNKQKGEATDNFKRRILNARDAGLRMYSPVDRPRRRLPKSPINPARRRRIRPKVIGD